MEYRKLVNSFAEVARFTSDKEQQPKMRFKMFQISDYSSIVVQEFYLKTDLERKTARYTYYWNIKGEFNRINQDDLPPYSPMMEFSTGINKLITTSVKDKTGLNEQNEIIQQ